MCEPGEAEGLNGEDRAYSMKLMHQNKASQEQKKKVPAGKLSLTACEAGSLPI